MAIPDTTVRHGNTKKVPFGTNAIIIPLAKPCGHTFGTDNTVWLTEHVPACAYSVVPWHVHVHVHVHVYSVVVRALPAG